MSEIHIEVKALESPGLLPPSHFFELPKQLKVLQWKVPSLIKCMIKAHITNVKGVLLSILNEITRENGQKEFLLHLIARNV